MKDKASYVLLLVALTTLAVMVEVWIVTQLHNIMMAYRNMDDWDNDPEPTNLPVAVSLLLVNVPLVSAWIAFLICARRIPPTDNKQKPSSL
jgi:hypothetical protein